MEFNNKVVVITGGARGLGRTYAVRFAELGAQVVVCDLRSCDETVAAVEAAGGQAVGVEADVTDMDSTLAVASAAEERFGGIDILVNNAALWGSLGFGGFESIDPDEWDATMRVNVKGIWHCCRAAVPSMRSRGGGSIVNIASLAAIYGMPFGLHYTTSKAAVVGLTRGLAREVGRDNIRVNSVAPNVVDTEASEEFFGNKLEKVVDVTVAQQCIRRGLQTDDVVGTVLYLSSDLSTFTTGQTIMVDGGTEFL